MKKIITLISAKDKTKEQLVDEAHEAVQKYFRVEKEVLVNIDEEHTPRKSADELMAEYKAEPERETLPPGQEEAFVSFHSDKKNDKK